MTDVFAPERDALSDLAESARAQLLALRDGSPDAFEAAAGRTLDAVAALDHRRRQRERATAAPDAPHVSPDDRAALRADARAAQDACETLEVALGHAVALGRDLIGSWRHLAAPATSHVYTAAGAVGPPR